MDTSVAAKRMSALAQESRLQVFRLLVEAGKEGLPAGEIARALGIPHNTMSSHLGILQRAGLIRSQRHGRSIIYAVAFPGLRELLSFLLEDCCRCRPNVCAPLLDAALPACCHENPRPPAKRAGSAARRGASVGPGRAAERELSDR